MKKVRIGVFGAGRGMTMVHEIIGDPMAELVAVGKKEKRRKEIVFWREAKC